MEGQHSPPVPNLALWGHQLQPRCPTPLGLGVPAQDISSLEQVSLLITLSTFLCTAATRSTVQIITRGYSNHPATNDMLQEIFKAMSIFHSQIWVLTFRGCTFKRHLFGTPTTSRWSSICYSPSLSVHRSTFQSVSFWFGEESPTPTSHYLVFSASIPTSLLGLVRLFHSCFKSRPFPLQWSRLFHSLRVVFSYPDPIPCLTDLVKWAKRLLHKVKTFQTKHDNVRRYFQSMRNYLKYYNLDLSIFRSGPLTQRLEY